MAPALHRLDRSIGAEIGVPAERDIARPAKGREAQPDTCDGETRRSELAMHVIG